MSSPTPRPGPSWPAAEAFFQMVAPVRASSRCEPASPPVRSWMRNTSRPGRLGTRSPTWRASPWPGPGFRGGAGVAVAVAGAPQSGAVVVHGHAAEDDLVAAVTVDVGDAQV